jgi:hypothetical protein
MLRSKWASTTSTASCTPSWAVASASGTGPSRTGVKEMAGSWLRKQVRTWSTTSRATYCPSASRHVTRVDSRRCRRSAAESSGGRTAPIEEGASATWMGLSPRDSRAVLASPTHFAICSTPVCCSARSPSTSASRRLRASSRWERDRLSSSWCRHRSSRAWVRAFRSVRRAERRASSYLTTASWRDRSCSRWLRAACLSSIIFAIALAVSMV